MKTFFIPAAIAFAISMAILIPSPCQAQTGTNNGAKVEPAVSSDSKLDETMKEEVFRLIEQSSFSGIDYPIGEKEILLIKQNQKILLTRPGVMPYLMYWLDDSYRKNPTLMCLGVLNIIGERGDLTQEQLKYFTDEMRSILLKPKEKDFGGFFLNGGLKVLKHFPSQENEKLAVDVLQFSVKMKGESTVILAARTLEKIGREKSLLVLQDVIEHFDRKDQNHFEEIKKAKEALEKRLKEEDHGAKAK